MRLAEIIAAIGAALFILRTVVGWIQRYRQMGKWLPIVVLACLPSVVEAACTGSSPTWTASIDRASVASCVASAVDGDIITVEAGTAIWTTTIDISGKGLTITGAGTGSSTGSRVQNSWFRLLNADNTVISGFRVTSIADNYGSSNNVGWGVQGTHNFRIHHNWLECDDWWDVAITSDTAQTKLSKGLLDHNHMVNCRYTPWGDGDGDDGPEDGGLSWAQDDTLGTDRAIFFEDNTVDQNQCFQGNSGMECNWIDGDHGASWVVRFNSIQNTYLECHPFVNERGARLFEAYYNTFDCTGAHCSGGTTRPGLSKCSSYWHNNHVPNNSWGWITINDDRNTIDPEGPLGMCDGTDFPDQNKSPTATYRGYLCRDQVGAQKDVSQWNGSSAQSGEDQSFRPVYWFANADTGGTGSPSTNWEYEILSTEWNPTHIKFDREIYIDGSSFDGTTGVGVGTLAARPSTCTTNPTGEARSAGWGVGYWATDQGAWNHSTSNWQGVQANGADGVLYVCTATNTWTLKYTPYTYPHPLQGAEPPMTIMLGAARLLDWCSILILGWHVRRAILGVVIYTSALSALVIGRLAQRSTLEAKQISDRSLGYAKSVAAKSIMVAMKRIDR